MYTPTFLKYVFMLFGKVQGCVREEEMDVCILLISLITSVSFIVSFSINSMNLIYLAIYPCRNIYVYI